MPAGPARLDVAGLKCIYIGNDPVTGAGGDVTGKTDKKPSARKDSQLILRLDKRDRDAFVALCKKKDTTAAREIRRFIREYLSAQG